MTVHKAQGSEFDHVALVLPSDDIPLNTREILYTALTRSRTSVTIIGRREIFSAAAVGSTADFPASPKNSSIPLTRLNRAEDVERG